MIAQHSTISNEHYTPSPIVEAARQVMGGIDLDPASCELANKVVKANRFYSIEDDALNMSVRGNNLSDKKWSARSIFLNPPGGLIRYTDKKWIPVRKGGKSSQAIWWDKLFEAYIFGGCEEAIFVAFSVELLGKRPIMLDFPLCFTTANATDKCVTGTGRTKFNKPCEDGEWIVPGNSPTHMNLIVYLPLKHSLCRDEERAEKIKQFGKLFRPFGNPGKFEIL